VARLVTGTRNYTYDHGLTHLLQSELHWLDIPEQVLYYYYYYYHYYYYNKNMTTARRSWLAFSSTLTSTQLTTNVNNKF